jgi:hypothetical protein
MPLNPAYSIFERMQMIQRDVVADLPPLNLAGSPKLGTIARLNNGQFWCVVVDDASPTYALIWQQIGAGAVGSVLPDVRFVVGKLPLNLNDPGVATYTSIAQALAAVQAYQLATGGLPATIILHPDTYVESPTLPPNVSMQGLGGSNTRVFVNGTVRLTGSANSSGGLNNLACAALEIEYSGGTQFFNVREVEVAGSVLVTRVAPGFGVLAGVLNNVIGSFSSTADSIFFALYDGRYNNAQFADPVGGAGIRAFNVLWSSDLGGSVVSLRSMRAEFANCFWDNGDDIRPILSLEGGAQASVTTGIRLRGSAPHVVVTPDATGTLYWSKVAGPDIDAAFAPNLALREAFVTADGNAGIAFPVVVDGVSVPEVAMPSAAETVEVVPSYAAPIDPTRANNAFALLRVADAAELINRKRVTIVNISDPTLATSGPIALVMAPGNTINQLTGTAPVITSLDYVILAPGDFVTLSRVPSGWVIAQ